MTDTTITTDEGTTGEEWPTVPLERAEIAFLINVEGVEDLAEALDIAAISLLRHGMDSFHILVTDPDTERQWIVHNGTVAEAEEGVEELQEEFRRSTAFDRPEGNVYELPDETTDDGDAGAQVAPDIDSDGNAQA